MYIGLETTGKINAKWRVGDIFILQATLIHVPREVCVLRLHTVTY